MSTLANAVVTVIVLLAPAGLIYGWYFYLARMYKQRAGWRGWVTLACFGFVSTTVVMWPVARMTAPEVNWHTWVGAGAYMNWVNAWERVALRILLGTIALSLFVPPRLIVPMIVACLGTGLFWISSNIP